MTREVGILTARGHPLLPTILEEFARHQDIVPVLLVDARELTSADVTRFHERTAGAFAGRVLPKVASVDVPDHNGPALRALLHERGIRTLANAGTPRRIGRPLLDAAAGGLVNAHPGILPKYRGASAPEWAIYNDDPIGVTAHFMDEGLDSGPIIVTEILDVRRGWDYVAVRVALYKLQARVLADVIAKVVREGITPRDLPSQPSAIVLRPIPDELLAVVKQRLSRGEYAHSR